MTGTSIYIYLYRLHMLNILMNNEILYNFKLNDILLLLKIKNLFKRIPLQLSSRYLQL